MAAGKLVYLPAAMWRTNLTGYVFWVLPAVIQTAAVMLIWHRRLVRMMPFFFAFLCEELVRAFVASIAYAMQATQAYFYLFWALTTLGFVLGLGAIYEVFLSVFATFDGLRRLSMLLFRWIAVALVMAAVVSAAAAHGNENTRLFAGLVVLDRSVRLVQVGLLLSIFLLSTFFGLAWKNHVFGVALGLAILTSSQLAVFAMRARFGVESQFWFQILSGVGELGGYGAVLVFLTRPVRNRTWGQLPVTELEDWNQSLAGLLNR
jgi:hypothetical protein